MLVLLFWKNTIMLKIVILGCGSSAGVPVIGCKCNICISEEKRNKRTRSSILIVSDNGNILIDTSPDLRYQALANNINSISAILYTHYHADHVSGIDDLRSFNYISKGPLPIYADKETLCSLQSKFSYAFFNEYETLNWYKPSLIVNEITNGKDFLVNGLKITPFKQAHGNISSLGFKFGNMAYSTDVNFLSDDVIGLLKGIKIWVVDCLGYKPSKSHAHLDLVLSWVEKINPQKVILTHMGHEIDYIALKKKLPNFIEPAYDGMII
ncbi:Metallo-beta-lactamase family protein [Rickettsiales bacterium Ac37b]|nr:Metallo-beta-lactamase family protein [Rickettsiales bacterium Ac37b]